jgi:hypothetical protein
MWVLNSKYLAIEPNGSNTLGASLFTLSLLFLLASPRDRWLPAALVCLYLAKLARPEMGVVLACVVAYLILQLWFRYRSGHPGLTISKHTPRAWVLAVAVTLSAHVFVVRHVDVSTTGWSSSQAFVFGFAVTYVEREGLSDDCPNPWDAPYEIVSRLMPGVMTPEDALVKHPRLVAEHVAYNAKKAIRVFLALWFGFLNRGLQAAAIALYALVVILIPSVSRASTARESLQAGQRKLLLAWAGSAGSLLPVACVLIVLWRYFLPLLPLAVVGAVVLLELTLVRTRRLLQSTL